MCPCLIFLSLLNLNSLLEDSDSEVKTPKILDNKLLDWRADTLISPSSQLSKMSLYMSITVRWSALFQGYRKISSVISAKAEESTR